MMALEDIRRALGDRRVRAVADAINVDRQTIYNILSDPHHQPRARTLQALSDYFSRNG